VKSGLRHTSQRGRKAIGDLSGGFLNGVVRQVRITQGRGQIFVAQNLFQREGINPIHDSDGGIGMAQVVDPDVLKPSPRTYLAPRFLKVVIISRAVIAQNDVRIPVSPISVFGFRQGDSLSKAIDRTRQIRSG
jgi:hypothetical protein